MSIEVEGFPRIHMGLLDLSGTTSRAYGGAGFSIEGLRTRLRVEKSHELSLSAPRLSERDREDLHDAMKRWEIKTGGCGINVQVVEVPPQHVGLGTKTTMILGILSGANNCWDTDYSRKDLQKLSNRGGVSGIGINAFFTGGFVVDAGHPESDVPQFAPSSFSTPSEVPPVAVRSEFPPDWRITLYLPEGNSIRGDRELALFKRNTPIPVDETMESLAIMYHGIVPAFLNNNLVSLSESLERFHKTGFKKREVEEQSKHVMSVLDSLQEQSGVAVGMSSVGPLVYAIHKDNVSPEPAQSNNALEVLGTYPGRNTGAIIHENDPQTT